MQCQNCSRNIPDNAARCQFCEAKVEPPPAAEELETVRELLETFSPEMHAELRKHFEASETADDFVNRLMIGDCPSCGSSDTGDCEEDPEIDNILVARCFDCGKLWCCDCEKLLTGKLVCECWENDVDEDRA